MFLKINKLINTMSTKIDTTGLSPFLKSIADNMNNKSSNSCYSTNINFTNYSSNASNSYSLSTNNGQCPFYRLSSNNQLFS